MAETKTCPKCGAELPSNAPAGICPKCLMQAGLASEQNAGSSPEAKPTTCTAGFVPPEPEELAEYFPQLEILELLGQGGMGAVYKARQPGLDRLVALKILPPEVGADAAFAERFTREARVLAKLNHPNIVQVYDFGQVGPVRSDPIHQVPPSEEDERGEDRMNAVTTKEESPTQLYYFIMEYVDGTNLRNVIQTSAMKPAEALAIVPQICEALQFAHDQGIVHRDIKPENILVDKQGRVKIADFGLAKLMGKAPAAFALTGSRQVMGTVHYMAPEQMRGAHNVDHRADIYSLGVVFYEMLTGELPIGRFEPPSKKVQIDVRLDEVVLHALESQPERRYQQVSEVKTDVERVSRQRVAVSPSETDTVAIPPDLEKVASARRQVFGPAVGLTIAGSIGLLLAFGVAVWILLAGQNAARLADATPRWLGLFLSYERQLAPGVGQAGFSSREVALILGIALLKSIPSLILIVAAQMMRRIRCYGFAMAGAILALLPLFGPVWLLSLPMGIWALSVLTRSEVKAAFSSNVPRDGDSPKRIARWILLASAVLVGVVFAIIRPDISDAMWELWTALIVGAFVIDVVRYRGRRRGLSAAFVVLFGLTIVLIGLVVQPEPLLNGLYRVRGVAAGQDDPTVLRIILSLVAAWFIWQIVGVCRRLGQPFAWRIVVAGCLGLSLALAAVFSYVRGRTRKQVPLKATAREATLSETERDTPGLSIFRYALELPPEFSADFSAELWRQGKREPCDIHPGARLTPLENNPVQGTAELRLQEGEALSPLNKGKLRWDFKTKNQYGVTARMGGWMDDPFIGMQARSSSWRGTEQWPLTPGKEHTLLILQGWKEPSVTARAEAIKKGALPRADVELYLKVRLQRR